MAIARRRTNRVDPRIRKARKDKLALRDLGTVDFILWGFFGFGIMLLALAAYYLINSDEQGILAPISCACFAIFFSLGKMLFAKRD